MKVIEPTQAHGGVAEVQAAMKRAKDVVVYRRLQAILCRIQGKTIEETCRQVQISRDTLHAWVRRWNEGGVERLLPLPRTGRPRKLTAEVKDLVIQEIEGRLPDGTPYKALLLHGQLKKRPALTVGYSTLCRNLREWGYVRLRPRPKAHKADPVAQAAFVTHVQTVMATDDPDIWFGDETSFWGDPAPYLIWAKKGSKPTIPYHGQHYRVSVVGAVRPRDGEFVALLISTGNSSLFQIFLDELNRQIHPARRNILILDNASFHKVKSLNFGRLEPWFLPPYSPELNPIEEVWLLITTCDFHHWMAKNQEQLEDKVADALRQYMNQPQRIQSIASMSAYF